MLSLQLGQADEVLKAEEMFDEGFNLLEVGRFRDARKMFEKCLRMKGHRSDTMIYLIWALIREKKNAAVAEELAEKAHQLFNQVPHEDRHSPQYFFVKGLQFELMKDPRRAYAHFKHAYTMDPQFLEAKKEIAFIKRIYGQQKTTVADDLSHVVTKFFKKRTG
jgi:tetratricopeptide (TPR) repeat protein